MYRYASGRFEPPVDPSQDITDAVASFENGVTTINFTRPRNSGDPNDLSLDQCRYLLYAYGPTASVVNATLSYHGSDRGTLTERFFVPSAEDCPTLTSPGTYK